MVDVLYFCSHSVFGNIGLKDRRKIIKGCCGSLDKKDVAGSQKWGLNISLSQTIMKTKVFLFSFTCLINYLLIIK